MTDVSVIGSSADVFNRSLNSLTYEQSILTFALCAVMFIAVIFFSSRR